MLLLSPALTQQSLKQHEIIIYPDGVILITARGVFFSEVCSVGAEFDIPVGEVKKMTPAMINSFYKGDTHEWSPMRFSRISDQAHTRLLGRSVSLLVVAGDATAYDIIPCRFSPMVPRDHVVKI